MVVYALDGSVSHVVFRGIRTNAGFAEQTLELETPAGYVVTRESVR